MSSERFAVFIDGSNLYNGLQKQFGDGRIDMMKLVNHLASGRAVASVLFFVGLLDQRRQPEAARGQQRFLAALSALRLPLQIFSRPMHYYSGWPKLPPQEKGIDALIVQGLIMGAVDNAFESAALISGDQDFAEVVRLISTRFRIRVETLYPASRRHLFESTKQYFHKSEVITKKLYEALR